MTEDEIVGRMAQAIWGCEGFPGNLNDASSDTQERLKHMARAALSASGLQERVRDAAAVAWLMGAGDTDDAAWATNLLSGCRDEEHFGDCTKAPITCNRCLCDEALEAADKAKAALKASEQEKS